MAKRDEAVTLKTISEVAGTSLSTVAKALKGHPGIADATRERIEQLAKELGYSAHGAARAIVTGRTNTVAIVFDVRSGILPETRAQVLMGVARECHQWRQHLMFVTYDVTELSPPRMFAERVCDGVIVAYSCDPAILDHLDRVGMPWCSAYSLDTDTRGCVLADDEGGIRQAVAHLAQLGHKRIAYVNSDIERHKYIGYVHVSVDRRAKGYERVMAEMGLCAYPGSEKTMPTAERIGELLEMTPLPTALVCFEDRVALSAIQELRRRGLRVPEDASVIGTNDGIRAEMAAPPLTTIKIPFVEIGSESVKLLLETIEGRDLPPRRIVLPETLVVRESTGPAPEEAISGQSAPSKVEMGNVR